MNEVIPELTHLTTCPTKKGMGRDCQWPGCAVQDKPERVNHPIYYGGKDNPYEVIKVMEAWQEHWPPSIRMHLCIMLRYVGRAGVKDSSTLVEDLEKGRWYLDRAIAHYKKVNA